MSDVNTNDRRAPGFDPRLFLRDEELDYGIALILSGERALSVHISALSQKQRIPSLASRALIQIRFEPGLSVTQLRDRLNTTPPTLARILADLGKRNFLDKRPSNTDARQRHLFLTEEGQAATEDTAISMRNAMRKAYRDAGANAVAGIRAVLEGLL